MRHVGTEGDNTLDIASGPIGAEVIRNTVLASEILLGTDHDLTGALAGASEPLKSLQEGGTSAPFEGGLLTAPGQWTDPPAVPQRSLSCDRSGCLPVKTLFDTKTHGPADRVDKTLLAQLKGVRVHTAQRIRVMCVVRGSPALTDKKIPLTQMRSHGIVLPDRDPYSTHADRCGRQRVRQGGEHLQEPGPVRDKLVVSVNGLPGAALALQDRGSGGAPARPELGVGTWDIAGPGRPHEDRPA